MPSRFRSLLAVWTAWTTECPTGDAAWTWAMVGAEGALWGVYGLGHGDRAVTWFAGVAMARQRRCCCARSPSGRSASPQSSPQLPQRAVAGERVIEGVGVVWRAIRRRWRPDRRLLAAQRALEHVELLRGHPLRHAAATTRLEPWNVPG